MEIINLTPHALVFRVEGKPERIIPASGVVARCTEKVHDMGEIDGIPIVSKSFGEISGLPEPNGNTKYVTSAVTAIAAWKEGRGDVLCPGNPIRDEGGNIIGCAALCTS